MIDVAGGAEDNVIHLVMVHRFFVSLQFGVIFGSDHLALRPQPAKLGG